MIAARMQKTRKLSRSRLRLSSILRNTPNQSTSVQCTIALLLMLALCSGCRSLRPEDNEGLFRNRNQAANAKQEPNFLQNLLTNKQQDTLKEGEKFSAEGQRKLALARQQFDAQQYTAAIKSYRKIATKYAGSSIGEEAWFRISESYFALGNYPNAQDSYNKLFAEYPSTKYVSDASSRLFSIAKAWLEVSDPVVHQKIVTVSDTKVIEAANSNAKSKSGLSAKYRLVPNFFDKSRPLLDTPGRAQGALKSIWLNDPTGPLADDALMLTATYFLERENFVEADRYLEILRNEYPDSPHLEQAYTLGGQVKQASYQGPLYDGTSLYAATKLKERSLSLFPDSENRANIQEDLKKLYLEKAERVWGKVEVWQKKGNQRAVAIQCKAVIDQFPDTPYASHARAIISQIPIATVEDLPGMAYFIQRVRASAEANRQKLLNGAGSLNSGGSLNGGGNSNGDGNPNSRENQNGPVKSVSDNQSRNPIRLLGFGN